MQARTSSSLRQQSTQSDFYNTKISVLSAVNKLKEAEEKILQAKKKQLVQKRIEEARVAREKEQKKSQEFKKVIRSSVEVDKRLKEEVYRHREKVVDELHEVNSSRRKQHASVVEEVQMKRQSDTEKVHQQIRSNRIKNEFNVRQFRKMELDAKIRSRMQQSEVEQRSRERVRSFRESRINFIKQSREKDVENLQRKLETRYRFLQKIDPIHQSKSSVKSNSFLADSRKGQDLTMNPESLGLQSAVKDKQSDGKRQQQKESTELKVSNDNKNEEADRPHTVNKAGEQQVNTEAHRMEQKAVRNNQQKKGERSNLGEAVEQPISEQKQQQVNEQNALKVQEMQETQKQNRLWEPQQKKQQQQNEGSGRQASKSPPAEEQKEEPSKL